MTNTSSSSGDPVVIKKPIVPSAKEIYNQIMRRIEPELTYPTVETINQNYVGETPEQREQRRKRYRKAFAEYERQFAEYDGIVREKVQRYKHEAFMYLEKKADEEDERILDTLNTSIAAA